ncbi:hypothetical protein M1328_02975 [Patescibacteria group bacterium]|nr:hypothetical protein [Patescibacteria group bacterium]
MKLKIKPYLLRLIKENVIYILSSIILLILIVIVAKISIDKIFQTDTEISTLSSDINNLQRKLTLFQTVIPSSQKLDEDVQLLNGLIPNTEDYFSVIYALETLSQKTGFNIIGYSVNINKSTAEKLQLTVTGVGDSNSFLKFLDNYNYAGGRLITSNKIELNPQISGSIKLDLTFYNKKTDSSNSDLTNVNSQAFKDLEAIKQKVSFDFNQASESSSLDLNYPKKNNPF